MKYRAPEGFKIVSGGQTGADQAGLDWAIASGIAHGGWCPKGRRSESGSIAESYLLIETPSANYLERTEWNVRDSDATVIFTLSEALEGGSRKTAEFAHKHGKPCLHFRARVDPLYLMRFLEKLQVHVLNVAGSRESSAPGIAGFVGSTLNLAIDRARVPSSGADREA